MIDKLKSYSLYILVAVVGIVILYFAYKYTYTVPQDISVSQKDIPIVHQSDVVTASYKTTTAPDLITTTKYVAIVNGTKVEVPIKATANKINQDGATAITAKVDTEIDVTKLLPKAPNYEIGIGTGVHKDDVYIPISIQRNYKRDRAIEVEFHLDPSDNFKVSGVELQYKIKF